jgi:serine/threonine-protein kinase
MATDATDPTLSGQLAFGVGTVVAGTYEVTGLLGQGGMGAVFLARHLRLPGKNVALKILHQGGKDGDAYARFRREAEIVSRIGHPNLVEVLDFNTLPDGRPYLVLEFLAGESLAARVARGPLPVDAALEILRQIGSGLQAAHRAGVVHRDMKPDNVFLCPTDAGGVVHDRVKVLDFGISKIRGSQTVVTQDSVLIGTPQYMAPEQALGRNQEVDARADQFALACILYEMLAGRPPFSGDTLATVIYAIVHGPHVPLASAAAGVPPRVSAAVDRALAKQPDGRFKDIAAFVEAVTGRPLETLRGVDAAGDEPARPAEARPVPRTQPLAAFAATASNATPPPAAPVTVAPTAAEMPRRRSPAAAIAVVALVAVAGAGAVFYKTRTPPVDPPAATRVAPPPAEATRPPVEPIAQPKPPAAEPHVRPAEADSPPPPRPAHPTEAGPATRAGSTKRANADAEAVPPAAAEELAQAEAALAGGNVPEAIRLAQHSLYAAKSSRAFAIIAKGRCRQGDLGAARAALGNVAAAQRGATLRDCKAHGMDLR